MLGIAASGSSALAFVAPAGLHASTLLLQVQVDEPAETKAHLKDDMALKRVYGLC